jgi:lipopolysaccharide export system protein LptA
MLIRAGLAAALLLMACAVAQAAGWGELRTATGLVNVRLKPDARSPLLRALSAGTTVKVDFFKPGGWCAVFDVNEPERDESKSMGFVECAQLAPAAKAQAASAAPAPAQAKAVAPAGSQRVIEAKTEVRRARDLTSPVVAVLAPGEHVRTGFAREGFVAVFRMDDAAASESTAIGYIPEGMSRTLPSAPAPAAAKPTPAVKPAAPAPSAAAKPAPEVKSAVKPSPVSAPTATSRASGQDPVRITSDRMVYNQAENSVVFIGNVHGTHADMAIWANKITAYFTEKARLGDKSKGADKAKDDKGAGDFGDKIERIVAEGNVRLVSGKNEGACGTLTYYVKESMLRMDQNPILREGQNIVRGDVIKHYIRENRSEVLGGAQRRVEAIFSSPDKGEKK